MPEHASPHLTPLPAGEGRVRGDLSPTLHLTPADLPPRVRRYADNLKAQLITILKTHNVRSLEDLEWQVKTKKAKGELTPPQIITILEPVNNLLLKLNEIRKTGKLPESEQDFIVEHGKHTMDLREVLQASKVFYSSHNLHSLSDSLPDTPDSLSDEQRKKIEFALEQGFTQALILPDVSLQTEHLDTILEQTAKTPSDKLTREEDQYTKPYFNSEAKKALTHNRPSSSYLLLYSPGPIPEQTKGQTPENLIQTFKNNLWNSLTISEYLLLQRLQAETRGNHDWDAYSDTPKDSNWTWLLDSRTPSAVANASWYPRDRQVEVFWDDLRLADPKLGARPAVIVEL